MGLLQQQHRTVRYGYFYIPDIEVLEVKHITYPTTSVAEFLHMWMRLR